MVRHAPHGQADGPDSSGAAKRERRRLSPAAERALAEAAARRARVSAAGGERPPELDGRAGPEPVRYGDWEVAGRAVDF